MSSESLKKRKERISLARDIESLGTEMSPCSGCTKDGRRCVMLEERSSRCAECIRRKRSCNGLSDSWERNVPRESDWVSIERQTLALEEQEERAAQQAQEALARVARLRKQRAFLRKRREEMSKRGLKFLDELDAAEEKERLEAEKQTASENPTTPQAAFAAFLESNPQYGPDAFFLGSPVPPDAALSPSLWADLGFDDGIPPTTQGS